MREPDSLFPKRLSLLLGLVACALGAACGGGIGGGGPITITAASIVGPIPCPGAPPPPAAGHSLAPPLTPFLWANGYCNYMIPEYHDEQRLSDGGTDYGPVAYSFAFPGTALPQDHTAFDQGFVNVAIIFVDGPTNAATYAQLKLSNGNNCLYIRHHHPLIGSAKWEATMGPPTSGSCSGGNVQGVAIRPDQPSLNPADYPPVTRFSEAPGRRPMIGVRCGNVWCIVGAHGQGDIIASAHQGLPGAGTSPKWIVKGWFDDQTLGVRDAAGAHGILSRFRMSIVPHDDLGSYNTQTFLSGWTPVATIIIPKGSQIPAKYSGTAPGFGLADSTNVIEIRAQQTGASLVWSARVINYLHPAGYVYTRAVTWTDHSAYTLSVVATARWRWNDDDEDLWVRCDIGCCLVQGD